jgi:hypothetical protein
MEETTEMGSTCQTPLPLSEMSEKLRKIDPTGLLSDNEDEEMEQEQESNTADTADAPGNIHAGVHNLSNSEDADSTVTPAPLAPLPSLPPMMDRRILRSEFRELPDPTTAAAAAAAAATASAESAAANTTAAATAALLSNNTAPPEADAAAAPAAYAATTGAVGAVAANITASSHATPGVSGMLGTNSNKTIEHNFKKTSDGTAQTEPFQKNILENPKDYFKNLKVPTGVKKPTIAKNNEGTASSEPNAIPSKTYTAIIKNKKNSEKAGTIGGIASGQGPTECGSFFNPGDNRVLRSVYREDVTNVSVSSMSFNPVSWTCTACPRSHSVFDNLSGGGGGKQRELSLS